MQDKPGTNKDRSGWNGPTADPVLVGIEHTAGRVLQDAGKSVLYLMSD